MNFSNNPVEVVESELPLRLERYGYVPDSEGAGQYRGGLSLVREYRLLEETATLQLRTDRHKHLPYGLAGGQAGTPTQNTLNPDGAAQVLSSKPTLTIHRDEVFRHAEAGAGGWGNPLERDPALVLADVRNEKVSRQRARNVYGVAITAAGDIDWPATEQLRSEPLGARLIAPTRSVIAPRTPSLRRKPQSRAIRRHPVGLDCAPVGLNDSAFPPGKGTGGRYCGTTTIHCHVRPV